MPELPVDLRRARAAVREFLLAIGEDPDREGLRETPERVARAAAEIFRGLAQDPAEILSKTFDISHDELVLVRDIEVQSCCEHQVQERLTTQVADAMVEYLHARGVIVVIECEHMCMTMRGVRKPGSRTVTSAVRGILRDSATRAEAMGLITGR